MSFAIPAEANDRPSIFRYLMPVVGAVIGYHGLPALRSTPAARPRD
ncbi:MAG TPA: hypothetical protein VE913_06025 [Longimicrobium sp.]|nr:hypothetical protein [Longimicrobium sp.]